MPPYFSWGNLALLPSAPSGNTSAAAQQFYYWLFANYHAAIPDERIQVLWSGPVYIFGFFAILAGLFFLYTWAMPFAHRKKGELYGIVSFGGYILERIGEVEIFTWVFTILMVLWALYFIVAQCIYGQVY